jgi:zinc protease
MKHCLVWLVTLFAVHFAIAQIKPNNTSTIATLSAETIIQKSMEASGGKAIAAIKDVETKGTINQMGQNISFVQKYIVPGSFLLACSVNGKIISKQMAKKGIYLAMQNGQIIDMDDADKEELDEESALVGEMVYLSQKGYSFTQKTIEKVNGKDAFVVVIKSPRGRTFTNYYSTSSFLKLKMSKEEDGGAQGKTTVNTYFTEYKTYNGVQIPVKITSDQGPFKMYVTINEVKINQGLKSTDIQ